MICIFPQNSFQRILVIFCLLVPDIIKIVSLFYDGLTLHWNNTLQQNNKSIGFIYNTGVAFEVFDIIYFHLALEALNIGRFS